jgi:hypothetical protein
LQGVSIAEGSFLAGFGTTVFIPGTIDNTLGSVSFTAGSLLGAIPGASGNGTLATIQFIALVQGQSSVNLANVVVLDSTLSTISSTSFDGLVTVQGVTTPEPSTRTITVVLAFIAVVATRAKARSSRLQSARPHRA